MKREKRTWYYVYPPAFYEVACNWGGKINPKHKIAWSEYAHEIWCYKCKKDMPGFGGIFDGPIPWEATHLMLGPKCFWRYNMVKKRVERPVQIKTGKIKYYPLSVRGRR